MVVLTASPSHAERAALYVLPHRMKRDDIPESQTSQGENGNSTNDQNQSRRILKQQRTI